jgi:hypothetical protein
MTVFVETRLRLLERVVETVKADVEGQICGLARAGIDIPRDLGASLAEWWCRQIESAIADEFGQWAFRFPFEPLDESDDSL